LGAIDEQADEVYFYDEHYQDERVIHLLSQNR
jgi:hypothetical protein